MPSVAPLSAPTIERLFPFFFILDADLVVARRGPSLARIEPAFVEGALIDELVVVERPMVPLDIDALRAVGERVVSVRLRGSGVVLRGQLVAQHDGPGVTFFGSPSVSSVEGMAEAGLSVSDFAVHDPVADFVYQLESKDARIRELTRSPTLASETTQPAITTPTLPEQLLLSSVSHELRTALNGILGMNELARTARSDHERDEWMTRVDDNANVLRHIVEDVLEVWQLETGAVTLETAPTSLARALEQVVGDAWTAADAKGIDIRVQVDPRLPEWVQADGTRVRRILGCLVDNAVKFTDVGHVAVVLESVHATSSMTSVRLTVTDTGPGIPKAHQARVFDRFYRADTSATRRHGGVGLGLTLAKLHVGAMGGRIELDSEPGSGCRFIVSLEFEPLVGPGMDLPAVEPTTEAPIRTHPTPAPPLRVLVAEDSPDSRLLVRTALEREGHWVDEATDGVQAVARACVRAYDLIFVDIEMPGMDGIEAARCIREHEARTGRPPSPMVVLTAHGLPSYRSRARDVGINACVSKPISRRELVSIAHAYGYRDSAEEERARHSCAAKSIRREDAVDDEQTATTSATDETDETSGTEDLDETSGTEDLDETDETSGTDQTEADHGGPLAPHPECMDPDTQDLFPVFLDSRYEELTQLHALMDLGDLPQVKRVGHTLKGTGGCYGYPLLSEIGAALESAARADDEAAVSLQVRRYTRTMQRIQRWVEATGWVTMPAVPEAFQAPRSRSHQEQPEQ